MKRELEDEKKKEVTTTNTIQDLKKKLEDERKRETNWQGKLEEIKKRVKRCVENEGKDGECNCTK